MKIVIDIPEETYQKIKETSMVISGRRNGKTIDYILFNAVANGTPLPEHHGRLIDADELKRTMEKDMRRALSFVDLTDFVWLAPTIIEADRSDSE